MADIARAVVLYGGRILILQNTEDDPQDYAKGKWEIPGGFVEDHDADEAAAVRREVKEEAGIDVDIARKMERVIVKRPDGPDADCQYYLAWAPHKDVEISREHKDHDWIKPENVADVDWYHYAAYTIPVVQRMVSEGTY